MQFRSGVVYAVRLSKRYTTSEGQLYNSGIWLNRHNSNYFNIADLFVGGINGGAANLHDLYCDMSGVVVDGYGFGQYTSYNSTFANSYSMNLTSSNKNEHIYFSSYVSYDDVNQAVLKNSVVLGDYGFFDDRMYLRLLWDRMIKSKTTEVFGAEKTEVLGHVPDGAGDGFRLFRLGFGYEYNYLAVPPFVG